VRERKETVTLKATAWELESWRRAAYTARRRDVSAFLTFAANTTARYIRELDRLRSPDAVMTRQDERRKLGALLKAAREAVEHLPPKPVERYLHGPLDVRRNLRRAIEAVDDFLQRYGEEYPCD
jgi:hypothetical protein